MPLFLNKIKKSKRSILLSILLLVGAVVLLPQLAFAQSLGARFGKALLNWSIDIFGALAQYPLEWASATLSWVIDGNFLGSGVGYQPYNNDIIEAGWVPVRNFANMFFIIALMVIGMATALRYKEYQAQKALPKLLIIALLINFTPAIAATIIDVADAGMDFFLGRVTTQGLTIDPTGTHDNLVGYIGSMVDQIKGSEGGAGLKIGKATFLMMFSWGATIIYFMFAVLFAARYVALWLLIILSPLAFICFVFPSTKKWWDQWWEQFIQWAIIGIPAAISLFLGREILSAGLTTEPSATGSFATFTEFIGTFTLPLIFLAIGYLATLKTSAMGAEATINFSKNAAKTGAGLAGMGAAKGAEATGIPDRVRNRLDDWRTTESIGERQKESEDFDEDYGMATRAASSMAAPAKRAVGRWALRQTGTTTEKIEDKVNNAKDSDPGEKVSKLKSAATNKMDQLAEILAGIEEGQLKTMKKMGLSNRKIKDAVKTASRVAPHKAEDVVNGVPTIADDLAEELDDETLESIGLEFEDPQEEERYGHSLTAKIAGNLDLNDIENLTEENYQDDAVQYGIHLDWTGRELSKAGQEHGRSFIETYNEKAKRRGANWYESENPGALNYLGNDAAQGLGYEKPSEEGEGNIITPSSPGTRKKVVKPEEKENTPRGRSAFDEEDTEEERGAPRGREGPGSNRSEEEDEEPPRGRMGI